MLRELSCAELAEHELLDSVEADFEKTAAQRREEERIAAEAIGLVKKKKRR